MEWRKFLNWPTRLFGNQNTIEICNEIFDLDLANVQFDDLYNKCRWLLIRKTDIASWKVQTSIQAHRCICLATLSGSGYIREYALKTLVRYQDTEAIPFVLWALKDWVLQVRKAARELLHCYLKPEFASEFVKHYRLISRLEDAHRIDAGPVLKVIYEFLLEYQCKTLIIGSLHTFDRKQRLFAIRLLSNDLLHSKELQESVAQDSDIAIRAWFGRQLSSMDTQTRVDWTGQLLRQGSTYVLHAVLEELDETVALAVQEELTHLVTHNNWHVRGLARDKLKDWSNTDFLAAYRRTVDECSAKQIMPGALAGLAELGCPEDVSAFKPFLNARRSSVRLEAVRGTIQLDPHISDDFLIEFLDDSNGRIRSYVIAVIARRMNEGLKNRLYAMIEANESEVVATMAIRTLCRKGGWDAVPAMLMGVMRDDEACSSLSWELMTSWVNRNAKFGWLRPSSGTLARIRKVLVKLDDQRVQPSPRHVKSWEVLRSWIEVVEPGSY